MTLPIALGNFQLTRDFACSPDRLWHCMTDAQMREAWGAPNDTDVLHVDQTDLRVGGQDLLRSGPAEAPDYTVLAHWYLLDAPTSVCFTETVDAGGMRIATTLVTAQIQASETGCHLTLDVAVSSFVGEEGLGDFQAGWVSALNRLAPMLQAPAQ